VPVEAVDLRAICRLSASDRNALPVRHVHPRPSGSPTTAARAYLGAGARSSSASRPIGIVLASPCPLARRPKSGRQSRYAPWGPGMRSVIRKMPDAPRTCAHDRPDDWQRRGYPVRALINARLRAPLNARGFALWSRSLSHRSRWRASSCVASIPSRSATFGSLCSAPRRLVLRPLDAATTITAKHTARTGASEVDDTTSLHSRVTARHRCRQRFSRRMGNGARVSRHLARRRLQQK
jgi:hypothetical protein